jgi:hypothetical protein
LIHRFSSGACGTVNTNDDFIVALNAEDFGEGYPGVHCGKTITMSFGGKTAQAKIMDKVRSALVLS